MLQRFRPFIRHKNLPLFILGALVVAPLLIMLILLIRYSVNVPFWDQWEYVDLVHRLHTGGLTLYDFWKQHNEHRLFFPRIVTLVLAKLTGYNVRFEVMGNFAIATGTFVLLSLFIRQTFARVRIKVMALMAASAWLIFSPIQWINWIWGFQLAFFMGVFFVILTIWLLTHQNNQKYFIWALATATIATYSLGNGLTIWFAGLVLLLLQKVDRQKLARWVVIGLSVMATYLYKFQRSPDSPHFITLLKEPVAIIKYVLTYLGRNVALTPTGARYTGAFLLGLLGISLYVIYRHQKLTSVLPWLAVITYVLVTACLAAASRLEFGVNHAMVYSYTTISVLFIVSLLVLMTYACGLLIAKRSLKGMVLYQHLLVSFVFGLVAYPLALSAWNNYFMGMHMLTDQGRHMQKIQHCVYTAISKADPCLSIVYPDPDTAWNDIQKLKDIGWGDFNH